MAIWYEGNRNTEQNRREKDGIVYYVRGLMEVDGVRYERYGIKTHFIEKGEDLVEILRKYVSPLYQEGDVVTLGEKVISMCQGNIVTMEEVKVGFWAKFLSKFAYRSATGTGLDFQEAVGRVHRLIEHALEFKFRDSLFQVFDVVANGAHRRIVFFSHRQFKEFAGVSDTCGQFTEKTHGLIQQFLLFADLLGVFRIIPQSGIFHLTVDFF